MTVLLFTHVNWCTYLYSCACCAMHTATQYHMPSTESLVTSNNLSLVSRLGLACLTNQFIIYGFGRLSWTYHNRRRWWTNIGYAFLMTWTRETNSSWHAEDVTYIYMQDRTNQQLQQIYQ